ncbi:MAG TPA: hypothetical protein VJ010_07335 [Actinomycetota bacterium]|nr:hypothetical protein [Actinomycetota bacterium]
MSRERTHHIGPNPDAMAQQALDGALAGLGQARNLAADWPSCELHLLASLASVVAARLPAAVARCREEGHSWSEIGDLLGVTKQSATSRFGPLVEQQGKTAGANAADADAG